jgi:hypothetical protein
MRQNKIWAVIACAAALAACELGGTTEWPTYTVAYNANGGSGSMESQVYKYSETKELSANAFTRDSYFFAGWAETPGGAVKYADRQSVKNLTKEDGATVMLYAEWKPVSVVDDVPGANLAAKLSWLRTNAQSNTYYTVEVTADESIGPATLPYSNRSNIGIILKGKDTTRIISLSSNGAMFTVNSGVILTLDNNITLQGRSNNTDSLVNVFTGGRLVMNAGSAITGNTYHSSSSGTGYGFGGGVYVGGGTFTMRGGTISGNTAYGGGGVYVGGGTFTMSGGTISGNTATTTSSYSSYGGGVAVVTGTFTMSGGTISSNTATTTTSSISFGGGVRMSGGTFTKTGGTIYGYSASDTVNSNAVKNRSGTVVSNQGHAVYAGKRKETTAGPSVYLSFNYNGGSPVYSGAWDY